MTSFTAKSLRVTFILSGSSTFSNGSNVITITGLRTRCEIQSMQFPAFPEASIDIFGMLAADMNTLTDYENHVLAVTRNSIIVEANAGTGWTTVFAGQIISASPTYERQPDVALHVTGRVLYYESVATTAPTSYTGTTDVATIISGLALRIGAAFENDGVSQSLSNPYFPGTIVDQIKACATHANIALYFDYGPAGPASSTAATTLPPIRIIIAPKGQPRSTPVATLTAQSGLVSSPTLDSRGWIFTRAYYDASFRFGGTVTISGSILPRANGTWNILQLTHYLDAVAPDGNWFSDMQLCPPGFFPYTQRRTTTARRTRDRIRAPRMRSHSCSSGSWLACAPLTSCRS